MESRPLGVYEICATRSMASCVSMYFPGLLRIDSIPPAADAIHGIAVIPFKASP